MFFGLADSGVGGPIPGDRVQEWSKEGQDIGVDSVSSGNSLAPHGNDVE